MSKNETIIKIQNGFPNIGGNGILLVCELINGKLEENDLLVINAENKIQIREVENIISSTSIKKFQFVITREFENIIKWSELFGTKMNVENLNNSGDGNS